MIGLKSPDDGHPIPRSTYEKNGYKPDFDKLPLEDEYKAAREKLRNAPRP